MTVRMNADDIELLRRQAAREQWSMNEVAVLAIHERALRHQRAESDREAVRRAIAENGPLHDGSRRHRDVDVGLHAQLPRSARRA